MATAKTVAWIAVVCASFLAGFALRSALGNRPQARATVDSPSPVILRQVQRQTLRGIDHIVGIAENTSTNIVRSALVSFNEYDGFGSLVGNTSASIAMILPGDKWEFACRLRSDCVTFRWVSLRTE